MNSCATDTETDLPPEDREIVERLCTNAVANDASSFWGDCNDSRVRAWQLLAVLPMRYNAYYQPFLAGGTPFWLSCFNARWTSAVLADRNPDVIEAYEAVRDHSDELLARLPSLPVPATKHKYQADNPNTSDLIGRVAQLIHLGVWADAVARDPKIRRKANLQQYIFDLERSRVMACSTLLSTARDVTLMQCDFEDCIRSAQPGDAVLFLPPPTSTHDDHARIASVFRDLTSRGVHCVASLPLRPELPELYGGYALHDLLGPTEKQKRKKGSPPSPPIRPIVGRIAVGVPKARV